MINLFELYRGAYKSRNTRRNLAGVKGLRSTLGILSLTEEATEHSGRILAQLESKGQAIDPRDLFVGVISLQEGFAVVTDNVEHFARIPNLQVVGERDLRRML